ncbi:MAG: hypothetical protein BGO53_01030 [Sphingobacteriales bacterium 39-19]|nr:DUF4294 domain-containing protein [Sphingobacteriales bacterium]OJW08956.1 MAG: hypothetical protein BGO53_01030 [Sphingobacteriales bacterium 39-19]
MYVYKKQLLILFICLVGILYSQAQTPAGHGMYDTLLTEAVIYNGDTIEARTLENVFLYSKLTKAQLASIAKYNRLRNAVYVTYPYARRAGMVMNDINMRLALLDPKKSRKEYILSREKELKKEFTDPLTNLSVYQGKVLMKLINRETGNNCYEIIKEYKGGLTARFYQTVAFFFNSNLKQPYDLKNTDDAYIEHFVKEVQRMYGYAEIRNTKLL